MGGPLNLKFANLFIIYQKRSLRGRLGLAGYTQSSGTGELMFVLFKALARGNRRKFGLQNQIKTIFNFNFYFHLQLLHKPVIIRISSFWI